MSSPNPELFQVLRKNKNKWLKVIESAREMVLANLALISQVPSQTFHEAERSKLLVNRFSEAGIPEPTTDDFHNAIGKYKEGESDRTILVFSHMDNQFDLNTDQNITITEDKAYGAGVADDNLSLAVLMTLPDIFDKLNIKFDSKIVLAASTRFHGRGDFGGIKNFINNYKGKIDTAININGTPLGVIDYFTLSRVRCDIKCELDLGHDIAWMKNTNDSAVMILNDIINRLFSISLPSKPKTILNIGMISGGERYSTVSREATANLEVLSEDDTIMDRVIEEINDNCIDIGAKHGANVTTDVFGRHRASGLSSGHPLMKTCFQIIKDLGYQPSIEYSNSEIAIPLSKNIPSVSIGITTGRSGSTPKSYIDIEPISIGILQLINLIYAIDREYNTK